jgi:hypothetical protein
MDRRVEPSLKNAGIGILSGLAGAAVMFLMMLVSKQIGVVWQPVPHRIWRNLEQRLGFAGKTDRQEERILGQLLHFGLGAGWGLLYGLASPLLSLPRLLWGSLYGLGTYAVDEIIMGPAFSLTPPPGLEPQRRVVRRVLMHTVFGLVVTMVFEGLRNRRA